ncbi:hypothetical protein [Albimonas pacifica]|uniref:Lipoprotein n=1 Tax=Albimonas pacifica TaxID=1114924 RepID=A0A1I3K0U9_9RHOB|nr:hypothetical protein [Albimonas pacifica]SFI66149.1 hypothetical protein SAMN05216258_108249 [Albimonas pacifica]
MSRIAILAAAAAAVLTTGCAYTEQWRAERSEEAEFSREIALVDRETWCGAYDATIDRQYLGPPSQGVASPVLYAFEPMGLRDFRALGYDALISKRLWHTEDGTIEIVKLVAAQSGGSELRILQNDSDRVTAPPLSPAGRDFLECLLGD